MPYPHMPISGPAVPSSGQFTYVGSVNGLYGQPVYASGSGLVSLAKADAMATSAVVGVLAALTTAPAGFSYLLTAGSILTQATALWDAIVGTAGGLVANTTYYLSSFTAGRFTVNAPSSVGQTVVPLLFALSPTQALLVIVPPIQL